MKRILHHPVTQRTRTIVRRVVITCAVILAVAFVTTLSVDLGPALRAQAERGGSAFIQRPMHIGRLGVLLWRGRFFVEDLVIEGLTPQSRPFLVAKRIDISMPWSTLFNRRVVFDAIEMTDWQMYAEVLSDGRHNFPKFTRNTPRGESAWTTTLQYVRAHRGEFAFQDHGTPWSTVARNIDVRVTRPTSEYRGQASFSNGTILIQRYEPMRADMDTTFRIVDGKIVLDNINLQTDGATSRLTGVVDASRWPEQTYQIRSHYDFATMRKIFFARDSFELGGEGDFTGTFHLFKEVVNGRSRTGRDLRGTFNSPELAVNHYRFQRLRGEVRWVPERLDVTNASTDLYGGAAKFTYTMAPLNERGVRATYTFDTAYENVDLTTMTNALEVPGIRLAGRASGRNVLRWPSGSFRERRGDGEVRVAPPSGSQLMARMPATAAGDIEAPRPEPARAGEREPFSNHTPLEPVPIGGELIYRYNPDDIELGASYIATPSTYVAFEGRTAYGDSSLIPFHVSSRDWQDSDRILAGIMTAFGSPTNAIPMGGSGTFDGTLEASFRRPRIAGTFSGERMQAFDVVWGTATGAVVIENSYADVKEAVIRSGDSTIVTTGRFSLGFPRRDGGEEINAIVRLIRRPIADLRHAFELDDYNLDGTFSGEFHVYGHYLTPYGFGRMAIVDGVAYGESFDTATAAVRLEGEGVRLDDIALVKRGGRGSGAAYVGWNGTYSFNFDGQRIPVESLALVSSPAGPPLSGILDFTAGGSGTFDLPRYDVRLTIRDFFVADEGIGQVAGQLNINGDMMTLRAEAASPRLAISGSGQVALTPGMHAELIFSVADTSLDPYIRAYQPDLSPYTSAIASGNIRVLGSLTNIDDLLVTTTVDKLEVRFFDYRIVNAAPVVIALDRHSVRVPEMRLVGEDTELNLSGVVNLHDERIAMRATGSANFGILQGLLPNIRSSGNATVLAAFEGPMRDPLVSGTVTVNNGRLRHFDLPHALENISGVIRFDSRAVRLDELTARLGGGPVQFSGGLGIQSYRPGRIDLIMIGQGMRLRYPEGMTSLVDAELTLQGTLEGATLGGNVTVRNAIYRGAFDANGAGALALAGSVSSSTAPLETTVPLRFDLNVSVPSSLRIENRAVQLQATADLQLRGTYDRPVLGGRAEIQRGEVVFEGRRYRVTRGTLDFNNPARIDPFFDIEAETRVRVPDQTYRVTVRAVGTVARMTTEFGSDPPLSQVEVVGLLFGDLAPGQDVEFRQYASVTPQQQLLQERAARALTSTISGEVGRVVEDTLGVDMFQLTPSLADPNAQSSRLDPAVRLVIGERLSERVFLTYSRSMSSSERDEIILIEYDQSDRLSWIFSRNEDRTYAIDVRLRQVF